MCHLKQYNLYDIAQILYQYGKMPFDYMGCSNVFSNE